MGERTVLFFKKKKKTFIESWVVLNCFCLTFILLSRLLKVSSYSLSVQAFDSGSPAKSTTVNVNIEIADVNDNPPIFSPANASAVIQVWETVLTLLFATIDIVTYLYATCYCCLCLELGISVNRLNDILNTWYWYIHKKYNGFNVVYHQECVIRLDLIYMIVRMEMF